MANKKFSEFTLKTDSANVDFVVGYDGTDNVRIAPSNLSSGGASDLNGLSDVVVNNTDENAYFINIPASRSGDLGNLGIGKDSLNSLTSGDYNTAIGDSTLNNLTTSEGATAIGFNAGAASGTNLMAGTTLIGRNAGFGRSGYRNVAIGDSPMGFGSGKTGVNKNTAIGYHALYRIDTNGVDNIAIGHEASQFLTTADGNIAIGDNAARSSTTDYHISIGYQAGYSQTSGLRNTNLGYKAGYTHTSNSNITNLGYESGILNTGAGTTNVGSQAGYGLTGGNNTTLGYRAGYKDGLSQSGSYNVYVGSLCAYNSSGSASNNTAIGGRAMEGVSTGSDNTCIGRSSGASITSGGGNTLVGYLAGEDLVSGVNNVAIGQEALKSETNHGRNVAVGYGVLQTQNAGVHAYNVGIGYGAGGSVNTGKQNTFLGGKTGETLTTGDNNTIIGYNSSPSAVDVDNEFTLGNSSITALRCAVTSITSLSDERDKSEIKDLEYGLNFIDALQPREFVWNNRPETTKEIDEDGNETEVEFYSANKGKKDFGFIAQEVQALDNDTLRLVYDENPQKLELSYA